MYCFKEKDYITTTIFDTPTKKNFNKLLKEYKKISDINKFNLYLTGGFCQNYFLNESYDTLDIDIFIINKNNKKINYETIRNVLQNIRKIGFKKNLLVDVSWVEDLKKYKNFITRKQYYPWKKVVIINESKISVKRLGPKPVKELIPDLYCVDYSGEDCKPILLHKNYKLSYKKINMDI